MKGWHDGAERIVFKEEYPALYEMMKEISQQYPIEFRLPDLSGMFMCDEPSKTNEAENIDILGGSQ